MQHIFRPGVVWALDDDAHECALWWYTHLGDRAKVLVSVATTWEEVRDQLKSVNQEEYERKLNQFGFLPDPGGMVANVVLMAGAMGSSAYTEWDAVRARLPGLSQIGRGATTHYVLLAEPEQFLPKARTIHAPAVDPMPWLISRRRSDGRDLSDETHKRNVAMLLGSLLLTSVPESSDDRQAVEDYFRAPPERGCVRLFGHVDLDFQRLGLGIAEGCTLALLKSRHVAGQQAQVGMDQLYERSCGAIRRAAIGETGAPQVLDGILGETGLGGWELEALLSDGPEFLSRLSGEASLLANLVTGNATVEIPAAEAKPMGFWRRLICRIMRKAPESRSQSKIQPVGARGREQCEVVLFRLRGITGYLWDISKAVSASNCGVAGVESAVLANWSGEAAEHIRHELRRAIESESFDQPKWEALRAHLKSVILKTVWADFATAVSDWPRSGGPFDGADPMNALGAVRWSAMPGGGALAQPQVANGPVNLGQRISINGKEIPFGRVSTRSMTDPFVTVASEPVATATLQW